MAKKQTRMPHPGGKGHGSGDADREGGGEPAVDAAALGPAGEVELAMGDLLGDANGEIVLFNDSGLRRMAIATDAAVVADGRAGPHRTASGQDVSGFRFLAFDNGLTLYYQTDLDVVVRQLG